MTVFKNIIICILSSILAAFFVYSSFAFGTTNTKNVKSTGIPEIKKSLVSIVEVNELKSILSYKNYSTWSENTGVISLDFGRLSTAFALMKPSSIVTLSGSDTIQYKDFQWIISLYDPFSLYNIRPLDKSYNIKQITNGSIYIGDEPDGTVSIYSIDAVVELSFLDQWKKMTDMIIFPGIYIRFDPLASKQLEWVDSYKTILVIQDDKNDGKNTGIEFVNPRVDAWNGDDTFLVANLSPSSRPLFKMLHLLFQERIAQVDLIKSYSMNYSNDIINQRNYIFNPGKKNYYLLEDLHTVLSRAVLTQMDGAEFRTKVNKIYEESKSLVEWNSVNETLENFLTDTRFASFGNSIQQSQFDLIYKETAGILDITPPDGKWRFFQYLSDIYSRNIIAQRKDPAFSWIDTYTPTAAWLIRTLDNQNIESKDYFDIALYADQILKKAQDQDMFTEESLTAWATYELIETFFRATKKYIDWFTDSNEVRWTYKTLVAQFYAPLANALTKSLYTVYTVNQSGYIFLKEEYTYWETLKIDQKLQWALESIHDMLYNIYANISPLYDDSDWKYALISFHDSMMRIGAFAELIKDGEYREYQKNPYIGIDVNDISMPSIGLDGKLDRKKTSNFQSEVIPEELPIQELDSAPQELPNTLPEVDITPIEN